ncbi:hypothetical protein L6164_007751 [Bauhinia variegata]|uniref:Uncharacterized protein n=1 Tax=Bauhinia variegata TaxID=167791 RepID=A0ACB9PED4_BAUVA|nr:hypothetical protein L6164_007751 [Bauhinia variegata]
MTEEFSSVSVSVESVPKAEKLGQMVLKKKRTDFSALRKLSTEENPPPSFPRLAGEGGARGAHLSAFRCFQLLSRCLTLLLLARTAARFDCRKITMKKQKIGIPESSKIKFEESEEEQSSSSSEDEEEEIEQELADVTFEELQKARSNGAFSVFQKTKEEKKPKRANKNRPMEASCKKPVPTLREVVQAPKKVIRDPRFESLCGKLDTDGFKKRYDFLFEKELPAEREALQKKLKKSKDPNIINEAKERISWIDKQLKSDSSKRIDAEILAQHKKTEREASKQGKRPFYIKKSEIRKQRLIKKYNDLKSSGKLDSYMEKKRRRNASKDRRYMPYRRSGENDQ